MPKPKKNPETVRGLNLWSHVDEISQGIRKGENAFPIAFRVAASKYAKSEPRTPEQQEKIDKLDRAGRFLHTTLRRGDKRSGIVPMTPRDIRILCKETLDQLPESIQRHAAKDPILSETLKGLQRTLERIQAANENKKGNIGTGIDIKIIELALQVNKEALNSRLFPNHEPPVN